MDYIEEFLLLVSEYHENIITLVLARVENIGIVVDCKFKDNKLAKEFYGKLSIKELFTLEKDTISR